jgi:hypothetical protein
MSEQAADFEGMLRQALRPVDPPEGLAERLEQTLTSLTELAAGELESWELGAMRDPRNWVRPVAAVAIGTAAGAGLVVLRVRAGQKRRRAQAENPVDLAERTLHAVGEEMRRLLKR